MSERQPSIDLPRPAIEWPHHVALGWFLAGVPGALLGIATEVGAPGLASQTQASAVDLGRHVGVGLLAAVSVALVRYLRLRPAFVWGLFSLTSVVLAMLTLPLDVRGFAFALGRRLGVPGDVMMQFIALGVGLTIPILAAITLPISRATRFARGRTWLRWTIILSVVPLAMYANFTISPGMNPSAHLFLTWTTALLLGNALASWTGPARLISRLSLHGSDGHRNPPVAGAFAVIGLSWPLWAWVNPHSNSVLMAYALRANSLNLATLLVTDVRSAEPDASYVPLNSYFAPRDELPPRAARKATPVVDRPIVILISIDSLRADVTTDPQYAKYLPNFHRMRTAGTYFDQARAPASGTRLTMASLSASKYFSQQDWSATRDFLFWPDNDKSVHWVALLSQAGHRTEFFPSIDWLSAGHPLLRGFKHNELSPDRSDAGWVPGSLLTSRMLKALEHHCDRPLLLASHYLESHYPFQADPPASTDLFTRYLQSLQLVDRYLGQVWDKVRQLGLEDRTLFLVTADHGEAFGEHNAHRHGSSLYDEQIKVPLLAYGAGVKPQSLNEPVSLIDVGPTILDWAALPIPGTFMGESLVPLLHGEIVELSRPIVAETGLRRAMFFRDGTKVIRDLRHEIWEIYDVYADPKELRNLSDERAEHYAPYLKHFQEFFAAHTYKRDGYRVPYAK